VKSSEGNETTEGKVCVSAVFPEVSGIFSGAHALVVRGIESSHRVAAAGPYSNNYVLACSKSG